MNEHDLADIYEAYALRVFRYMRYRVPGDQDAEDLTGAVFERVTANLHSFDARRGSFEAWLFAIARNQLCDHARRTKRRRTVALDEAGELPAADGSPEQTLMDAARFEALRRALARLNEREKQIVSLRYAGELRNVDIARVMRLSEKNVGVILCRALKKLRLFMTEEEPI